MQNSPNHPLTSLLNVLHRLNDAKKQSPIDTDTLLYQANGDLSHWSNVATQVADWKAIWTALPGVSWAMYFKDTGQFMTALLGAWLAGKTIYLPGDTLTHTTDLIKPHVTGFVGDFAEHLRYPRLPLQHVDTDALLKNLDCLDTARTVFLTSGSSGKPKLISKTLTQLCLESQNLSQNFSNQTQHGMTHATVSHQHFYGFIFRVLWPLLEQRALAAQTIHFPEELIHISKTSSDDFTLISSPAFLSRLTQRDDWQLFSKRLKAVFSAGGILTDEHYQHIKSLWQHLPYEIYGSTEHGATAYRHQIETENHLTTLPNVKVKVNTEGILMLNSPYMDHTDAINGWTVTSDKAVCLNDRQFELQGRTDRIVKIEEKRISLTQMEQTVTKHDWVHEAHIIAMTTSRLILGAVVVLNNLGLSILAQKGRAHVSQTLKHHLSQTFEHLTIPRRWRFVSDLPLNAQGKLAYHLISDILNTTADVVLPISQCMESSSESITLDLHVPVDLLYLKGHFNNQPIVPGVALVDWVIHYAHQYFPITSRFKAIKQLKFHHIIGPDQHVQLTLNYSPSAQSVKFNYKLNEQITSSGSVYWGEADV